MQERRKEPCDALSKYSLNLYSKMQNKPTHDSQTKGLIMHICDYYTYSHRYRRGMNIGGGGLAEHNYYNYYTIIRNQNYNVPILWFRVS